MDAILMPEVVPMRLRVDRAAFDAERRQHQLRFCCDDCAYFVPCTQQCAHGWPTEDHRLPRYECVSATDVVFCKEFELA
jgi:hypothetical protein